MTANPAPIRRGDSVTIINGPGRSAGQYGEVICVFRDAVTVLAPDHYAYVVNMAQVRLLEPAALDAPMKTLTLIAIALLLLLAAPVVSAETPPYPAPVPTPAAYPPLPPIAPTLPPAPQPSPTPHPAAAPSDISLSALGVAAPVNPFPVLAVVFILGIIVLVWRLRRRQPAPPTRQPLTGNIKISVNGVSAISTPDERARLRQIGHADLADRIERHGEPPMNALIECIDQAIALIRLSSLPVESRGLVELKLIEARAAAIRAIHTEELNALWKYGGYSFESEP